MAILKVFFNNPIQRIMNIYSYCYPQMKKQTCNNCSFDADFNDDNQRVKLTASICNGNMLSVAAYRIIEIDDCEREQLIWGPKEIDVNCSPEDCPFSNPTTPNCY